MSTKKRRKNATRFTNDKGIFNDYLTALTEVNMRILEMPVTKPLDTKYYTEKCSTSSHRDWISSRKELRSIH